jgi:hypothetical protein
MKRLLLILILTFSFQNLSKADDVRDFEIEGMSIGDSALDYFSESELIKNKKNFYNNQKYVNSEMPQKKNSKYHSIHVSYKNVDKNYIIKGISATILYQNNINECESKIDEIDLEVSNLFKNTKKLNKLTEEHNVNNTGKTFVTDIAYEFNNGDRFIIACYDWAKKTGYADHLRISVRSNEFRNFLKENAYE